MIIETHLIKESFSFRDVLPVVLLDAFTSIFAGTAIFSVLGYIAHTQKTDIDNVVSQGRLIRRSLRVDTRC